MSRHARLASLCFCLVIAGPLAAAEINVPPGSGTLAAAVANAADGDTLILSDGGYYGSVSVDRSLTIRPVNRSTEAVVADPLTIEGDGIVVTLQGVRFNNNVILSQAGAIRLLENIWNSGNVNADNYKSSEGDGSLVIVGNRLVSGMIATINSDNAYIAGNTLENGTIYTNSSAWIVGNDVKRSLNISNGPADIYAVLSAGAGATVRILGNRLSCTNWYTISCLNSSASSSLINGNIVQVGDTQSPNTNQSYNQVGISAQGSGVATVANNVVRGTPAEGATRSGNAIVVTTGGAAVTGNIVIDYRSSSGPIGVSAPTAVVTHNLCFNNSGNCNLNADPRFVDLVGFELAADSPAIDAGPPDYAQADLDRTRNDMGAHGGPWSIGQYDAQRDPYNYAPYVYPLFKGDSTFGGGVLEIQALGVAKLR